MNIAYADPPYLGCCALYSHDHGDDGRCWNDLETHRVLIERLCGGWPDGWALSLSSPSLREILPLCPADCRVSPWVKTFGVFKPNVNPAYVWEPIIWRGGRQPRSRTEPTVRDWFSGPITLQRGLCGAKSEEFVTWLFRLMGVQGNDTVTDIYPGTGVVGRTFERWQRYQGSLPEAPSLLNDFGWADEADRQAGDTGKAEDAEARA